MLGPRLTACALISWPARLSLLFVAAFPGVMPSLSAAAEATRLHASELVYRGAFAVPDDAFAYGGRALTFYPNGDPTGPADAYPGSLYVAGLAPSGLVGEISIPRPEIGAADFSALPVASVLREPADPTGGWFDNCTYAPDCMYREIGGLAYLDGQQKIAWNLLDWYNVARIDQDSLGWCNLDFSDAAGVWHIGPRDGSDLYHNAKASDYLFTAPQSLATLSLNGRSLLAGQHREAGALGGSQGPSLYATAPWQDGNPPAAGAELGAQPLLYYRESYNCVWLDENAINPQPGAALCDYPGYRAADSWQGGAWVEVAGRSAVLFFGRKGLGPNCYDTGSTCSDPCEESKGYHAYPYAPQILFYDTDELLAAAAGARAPWTVLPYETFSAADLMLRRSDCAAFGAAALDRANNRLYVAEHLAGESGETAIHVWDIQAPATDYEDQVYTLFAGYFGRPPAPEGLTYYDAQMQTSGGNYLILVDDFYLSSESQSIYGPLSTAEQVDQVYNFLFARDASAEGLSYWSGLVGSGAISVAEMAYTIAYSADAADAAVLAAKLAAAEAFTGALEGYRQTAGCAMEADFGRDFLAGIASSADAAAAIAAIDTTVATMCAP